MIPGVLSEARYSDAETQFAAAVVAVAVAAFHLLLLRRGTVRPPGPTAARSPAGRDSWRPRPCPASRAAPTRPWWPSKQELHV